MRVSPAVAAHGARSPGSFGGGVESGPGGVLVVADFSIWAGLGAGVGVGARRVQAGCGRKPDRFHGDRDPVECGWHATTRFLPPRRWDRDEWSMCFTAASGVLRSAPDPGKLLPSE